MSKSNYHENHTQIKTQKRAVFWGTLIVVYFSLMVPVYLIINYSNIWVDSEKSFLVEISAIWFVLSLITAIGLSMRFNCSLEDEKNSNRVVKMSWWQLILYLLKLS